MNAPTMDWREALLTQMPTLRGFARSLCKNPVEADDLVQDTLMKAWANRSQFTPGTNLRAWLFTILRNTYYTNVGHRRREVEDVAGEYANGVAVGPTQEWNVAMHSLQTALGKLPDEQREALTLVGGAGMTYEEAAGICNCAVGTIKSRVNRGRARLRDLLDSDEPPQEDEASAPPMHAHSPR